MKKYLAALKKTDDATLLAAAVRAGKQFADTEERYIPYPANWLHQERWLDEIMHKKRSAEDEIYRGIID